MAQEPAENPLTGMTWPIPRTIFRFFVVWDSPGCCGPDVECYQQAVSLTQSVLTCLACRTQHVMDAEVVEVVV